MAILSSIDKNVRYRLYAGLILLAVIVASLVSLFGNRKPLLDRPWEVRLETVSFKKIAEVEQLFSNFAYSWPPSSGKSVPRIAIDPLPLDYHPDLEVSRKKALFFRALLPLALAENEEIRKQRAFVQSVQSARVAPKNSLTRERLSILFGQYRVAMEPDMTAAINKLLHRMDEIPPALLLAQAANESAWGTSRFARKANNLFGQWTWRTGQGIIPKERPEGEDYAIRKFPSLRASVRDYIHNLNIGHAYDELRKIRSQMRAAGQPLDAVALAVGLSRYSERGEDYINEIRNIITGNRLDSLTEIDLMPADRRLAVSARITAQSTDG